MSLCNRRSITPSSRQEIVGLGQNRCRPEFMGKPQGHSPSKTTTGMPRSITCSARGYTISPLELTSRIARSSASLLAACSACRIPENGPRRQIQTTPGPPRGCTREETHLRRRERANSLCARDSYCSKGVTFQRHENFTFKARRANSIFTSPFKSKAMARSNSILPKPDVLGEVTVGPPAWSNSPRVCDLRVLSAIRHVHRSALGRKRPYFAAFVASSWMARPTMRATFEFNVTGGPRKISHVRFILPPIRGKLVEQYGLQGNAHPTRFSQPPVRLRQCTDAVVE